jgi:hypothetical protein
MEIKKNYSNNYILMGFGLIVSSLLISCQETKYVQCEQIITIANNVARETQKITSITSTEKIEEKTWLKAAEIMNKAAGELERLPIKDPQLLNYLADLVKIYRTNSEATYSIIKAKESRNLEVAQAAQSDVKLAGEWEEKLGSVINKYCQTK